MVREGWMELGSWRQATLYESDGRASAKPAAAESRSECRDDLGGEANRYIEVNAKAGSERASAVWVGSGDVEVAGATGKPGSWRARVAGAEPRTGRVEWVTNG